MKTLTIAVSLMVPAFLSGGCAANKVEQQRGWIGGEFLVAKRASGRFSGADVPIVPALPKQLEGKQKAGVFVSEVYTNTPLAAAGIRAGDLILAVNRQPVEKLAAFRQIIDGCKPGSTALLQVFRDGAAEDRQIRVGRETYRNWHHFGVGIMVSSKVELDLIPDPEFSLIALGYSRNHQRSELHSPRNEFIRQVNSANQKEPGSDSFTNNGEGWLTWLAIFSVGGHKSILSQEFAEPDQAVVAGP
jgi:membrane-associated protease RseP (regulator of RpoE activity)